MNNLEKRMVEALKDLKENHCVIGIKAEFEAEGTRMEEALRLKEVVTRAGLDLTIKIGGCEALKDMYDARAIGVSRIVAPMIESAYAVKKFLKSAKLAFPADEIAEVDLLINVETEQGYKNFDEMLALPEIKQLTGIVLGRVDMTGSLGLSRENINSPQIFEIANNLMSKAQANSLEGVIGGGVSKESLPFFRELPKGSLHHYETRKVIFKCPEALNANADKGILKAVGFELMWLKNKRDFYGKIFDEDKIRLEMLEKRYHKLIQEAGGLDA
ncbi:citrate lyase beta subunit [bacterium]|jgi:4-hydroxy-2-oxoheptanedioate aldolase|nr:citrate lyase beta subunit [bacterium]MBT3580777.1 citrate lyase beta subunit [bacterium]MBT4551628.1 citrate lyase beta subunit [bacterium]MBT5988740.1 citrate lyase beta subunit [bacterium]MBT7088617.1 citrate lyase beta subunit [bacterium]